MAAQLTVFALIKGVASSSEDHLGAVRSRRQRQYQLIGDVNCRRPAPAST
jgi:hypothetical protein